MLRVQVIYEFTGIQEYQWSPSSPLEWIESREAEAMSLWGDIKVSRGVYSESFIDGEETFGLEFPWWSDSFVETLTKTRTPWNLLTYEWFWRYPDGFGVWESGDRRVFLEQNKNEYFCFAETRYIYVCKILPQWVGPLTKEKPHSHSRVWTWKGTKDSGRSALVLRAKGRAVEKPSGCDVKEASCIWRLQNLHMTRGRNDKSVEHYQPLNLSSGQSDVRMIGCQEEKRTIPGASAVVSVFSYAAMENKLRGRKDLICTGRPLSPFLLARPHNMRKRGPTQCKLPITFASWS